jgi:hypothetical protein
VAPAVFAASALPRFRAAHVIHVPRSFQVPTETALIQIVDAAMAEAARLSGA